MSEIFNNFKIIFTIFKINLLKHIDHENTFIFIINDF